ncbi:MAG: SDR family oxidoreductase [Sphaerochaetaceae bacterium]
MFKDKICVITGGALGIGRCLTREFAKAGSKVAFIDNNDKAGKINLEYLTSNNSKALFYCGDLAIEEDLKKFSSLVIKEFGSIDFLINNASINKGGIETPCSWQDFNRVLQIGVTAPYMLTYLFLPYFNKNSSIVNIISTRSFMSQPNSESYTAAKGALFSLTHSLAVTLSGKVRVNSIAPGWIKTERFYDEPKEFRYNQNDINQHPSKRIGEAEDIARATLFLCDERNSFINGENITVDGGMTKQMIYSGEHGWDYK